jgi:hypothetical protein
MSISRSKGKAVATETRFQTHYQHPPVKFFAYKKGYKRRYGLELELEGHNFPIEPDGWITHNDQSLRNGVEYVLASPHDIGGLGNRVRALNEAFKKQGTIIQNSYRAGTHVHVNIQNELYSTICGLIIVEAIVEPILLRLCGQERNGSYFCLPTYDTGDLAETFSDLLTYIEAGVQPNVQRGKYACLNIDPISTFGTLEFRCFPASHDENQILTWVSWIENMIEIVKKEKDTTFWNLYMSFKHGGEELIRQVFPNTNLAAACQPQSVRELLDLGLETGYELIRCLRRAMKKKDTDKNKKFEFTVDQGVGDWRDIPHDPWPGLAPVRRAR